MLESYLELAVLTTPIESQTMGLGKQLMRFAVRVQLASVAPSFYIAV